MMLAFSIIPMSAAATFDSHGYRLGPTKTYFRDVQHNPELLQYLIYLSYVNNSIIRVHADHNGVTTFVHEIKFTIEDIEFGLDQCCEVINVLSGECEENENACQLDMKELPPMKKP